MSRRQPHLELIAARFNEGLSREMLALRAGVGRETVRLAEAGFVPTPRVQFALSKALGCRPGDLWPIESLPRPRQLTPSEKAARAERREQKAA